VLNTKIVAKSLILTNLTFNHNLKVEGIEVIIDKIISYRTDSVLQVVAKNLTVTGIIRSGSL
jgi:hypothetical protein